MLTKNGLVGHSTTADGFGGKNASHAKSPRHSVGALVEPPGRSVSCRRPRKPQTSSAGFHLSPISGQWLTGPEGPPLLLLLAQGLDLLYRPLRKPTSEFPQRAS